MAGGRTLHVRCATWEQVETFYSRKLRKGKLLSMKVPFAATIGGSVTLGLELPNEVVVAIDGTVLKASPIDGDTKTWIEVELHGFTDEVVQRIKNMASGMAVAKPAPAPEPEPPPAVSRTSTTPSVSRTATVPTLARTATAQASDDLPADERQLFQHLTAELKRMRQAAVHEVLGVERDADADAIRAGWMRLVRRHHPDLVARRKAPAITHLAEELTILCNRAYDRLRVALVAEGRATTMGAMVQSPPGWLVGFDDIASAGRTPAAIKQEPKRAPIASVPPPVGDAKGSGPQVHGGDTFETRARAMLVQGEADNAQEVLAAALVVYPRSRPLRSLYYVASAVAALEKGEIMLATSQLETALAHYDQCVEASRILDYLKRHDGNDKAAIRRLFQ